MIAKFIDIWLGVYCRSGDNWSLLVIIEIIVISLRQIVVNEDF